MTNEDPTLARPRGRRMLPSVGEVMRGVSERSSVPPEQVFKAARQVCSEELRRIKEGHESAPTETLIERTLDLLDPTPPRKAARAEDEVFSETGALDLGW